MMTDRKPVRMVSPTTLQIFSVAQFVLLRYLSPELLFEWSLYAMHMYSKSDIGFASTDGMRKLQQ
jgi:hypothetical protein